MKIICDWKDCKETGSYKAPVERDNSKKYRLLCLTHIKEFNKNWNYFENMNDQEIEFFIKSDITWYKQQKNLVPQIIFLIFYGIMHLMINLIYSKVQISKILRKQKYLKPIKMLYLLWI